MSEFDAARRKAFVEEILAFLRRRPSGLLPFEAVREGLRLKRSVDRGIRDVPCDRIVGSVERADEFSRFFLPQDESLRDRWEDVLALAEGPKGFGTVELYEVGEVYFVVDGHHRVSVARSLGARTIEARVIEYLTPVTLQPGDSLEDVLLKGLDADFLEATGLVPDAPGAYRVSVPGGYERLIDHINVHRYYRGIETGRAIGWAEGVVSWRDTVYRPMIDTIRSSGILGTFPGRTETDLYLFMMDHLHHLRERYGQPHVPPVIAVADVRGDRIAPAGLFGRIRDWVRRRVRSA
jgi:hypothetical protein